MKFSEYEHLLFERRDNGVLLVTMNRPDKYNAANEQMHSELARVWTEVSDDAETKVLLRLLTLATEARTVVAGRLAAAAGGSDVLTMRLIPSPAGSAVRTASGVLHLPGFELQLEPARRR